MRSVPTLIFMTVFVVGSLAAMLQNGFMVFVLGWERVQCGKLAAGDMIVSCLAASRFCLHGISLLNNLLTFLSVCPEVIYFNIPWDFINTLMFWLSSWLAFFYCVKISSFSHPIFFWLKWRISWLVPRLLLSSLILASLTTISSTIGNIRLVRMLTLLSFCGNDTLYSSRLQDFSQHVFLPSLLLALSLPFLLILVSTLLLMFSLHQHLQNMRDCRSGSQDLSTRVHTVALKSLTFFLIFYMSYFLSLVFVTLKITIFKNHWHWIWEAITYIGISLHSSILVLNNSKLRKALQMNHWKHSVQSVFCLE
ncbi:taste receptor type 2 member 134 [Erinaceus europaeus]|uniref:Taste receptor type 2 n=1 Tax=Erinaceus europaeus TaxID=9365 RepID=A0A1S3WB28_ERIEU|nr:taste receptor type 2 member 134 [Erinaceus europaeus]